MYVRERRDIAEQAEGAVRFVGEEGSCEREYFRDDGSQVGHA